MTLTADDLMCPDVDVFAAGIERSLAQVGVAAAEPRQGTACPTPLAARIPA